MIHIVYVSSSIGVCVMPKPKKHKSSFERLEGQLELFYDDYVLRLLAAQALAKRSGDPAPKPRRRAKAAISA